MLSKCYHGRNDVKMSANDGRSVSFFQVVLAVSIPKRNMFRVHRPPRLVSVFPKFADNYGKPSVAKFNLRYMCSFQ